ncbi:hypothetical protein PRNP1_005861 [Phytophthora ramorum]
MDAVSGGPTYFVSRHHEHPPATLEELLRVSAKPTCVDEKTDGARGREVKRGPSANDVDGDDDESDSDYEDEDSCDADLDNSDTEVDEWRLHAVEPREGLYLHEMRRQRNRMDEREAQWVRGYIKAQRTWKARTGRSIDEFYIPGSTKTTRTPKSNRPYKILKTATRDQEDEDEEASTSLFTGVTRLESLLLLAAIVFVCLSLGIQLCVSMTVE